MTLNKHQFFRTICAVLLILANIAISQAQTATYMNVKDKDGKYHSYKVSPKLSVAWGIRMDDVLCKDSPEGAVGVLAGRDAIVVDLGGSIGKVAVALANVGADSAEDTGSYFNFNDANNPDITGLSDDWYVPSPDEMQALAGVASQWNADKRGREWIFEVPQGKTTSLFFPAPVNQSGSDYVGYYWTNKADYDYGIDFYVSSGGMSKDASEKSYNYNIRPFHALPDE